MFGHLKSGEIVNLIEGGTVSSHRRTHLEACSRCRETWTALKSVYSNVAANQQDLPEPNWLEFRASVRNEMLSRSVKRQTASQLWTAWTGITDWAIGPAFAWSLSVLLAVGVTAGAFMWNRSPANLPSDAAVTAEFNPSPFGATPFIEVQGIETEIKAWSNMNVFEEIATLESGEAESLLELLEMEGTGVLQEQ